MLPEQYTVLIDRYKNNQLNQEEMAELRLAVLSGLDDNLLKDNILLTLYKHSVHDRWSQKMENEVWKNVVEAIRMTIVYIIGFNSTSLMYSVQLIG